MRRRFLLFVSVVLVALLAATGAVFAYDAQRDDLIAQGIKVGGVDVGGLRAHEARQRLGDQIMAPLNEPVVARYKGRRYTLTASEARVGVDLERSVAAALARSRDGSLIERAVRALSGEEVRADVPVRITHDESAVAALAARIAGDLDRGARDARLDLAGGRVRTVSSRTGRRLQAARLREDLTAALTSVGGDRTVRVRAKTIRPRVTSRQLADRYPAILIVNRGAFRLTLYKNLEPARTYRIAVGKAGMDTPAGRYSIQNKQEDPVWHVPDSEWAGKLAGKVIPADDPRNPIEARWMGIYDGAGIHGTEAVNSLGTRASHGCIRMAIPDVIELYDQVPVGAPVYIS